MDRTIIDSIKADYLKTFPESWFSEYDFSTESEAEKSALHIVSKTDDFMRRSFCAISSSVISGEYVVKDIRASLDNLLEILFRENPYEQFPEVQQNAYNKFCDTEAIILEAIDRYRDFIYYFENRCDVRATKHMLHLVRRRTLSSIDSYYPQLIHLLFKVCTFDIKPSYNDEVIKNLLFCHTELSSIISEMKYGKEIISVCEILRDKCMFLLKKILESDNQDVDYLVDYHQRHIGIDEQVAPYLKEFIKRFELYIKEQYENEPLADKIDKEVLNQCNKIWDLPLIIKYYKDKKGTTQRQVDNIIDRFNKQLAEYNKKGQYDKYALATLENYMANCRLSFISSCEGFQPDELFKEMDIIENLQDKTGIKNFYPFRKACIFLSSYIQLHRNDTDYHLPEILRKLDYYMIKLENALIWCKEQDYIPIQVPFEGCIVESAYSSPVFVPSTYCRPLQYERHFDELNKLKMDILVLRSEIRIQEDKKEIDNLKAQIDNSNKRLIEIFTLFLTVAAFIFGSIEFFAGSQPSGIQSFLINTVSLGIILLLFSSSVSLVTISKDSSWRQARCVLAIIMFLTFLALFITQFIMVFN